LEAKDDALDHEVDRAEYGEVVGTTESRVFVGNI
jgi:hypothetical protein